MQNRPVGTGIRLKQPFFAGMEMFLNIFRTVQGRVVVTDIYIPGIPVKNVPLFPQRRVFFSAKYCRYRYPFRMNKYILELI